MEQFQIESYRVKKFLQNLFFSVFFDFLMSKMFKKIFCSFRIMITFCFWLINHKFRYRTLVKIIFCLEIYMSNILHSNKCEKHSVPIEIMFKKHYKSSVEACFWLRIFTFCLEICTQILDTLFILIFVLNINTWCRSLLRGDNFVLEHLLDRTFFNRFFSMPSGANFLLKMRLGKYRDAHCQIYAILHLLNASFPLRNSSVQTSLTTTWVSTHICAIDYKLCRNSTFQ